MTGHLRMVLAGDLAGEQAIRRALTAAGWQPHLRRVGSLPELAARLADAAWDIAVMDDDMIGVDAVAGVELVRSVDACLPVVFVSGESGAEPAVQAMLAGADGYLPKAEVHRLGSVVERALRDGRARHQRRESEQRLKDNEERLGAMIESAVDAVVAIDEHRSILSINPAAQQLFGYRPEEVLGRNVNLLMPEPDRSQHDAYIARYLTTGERRIIGIGREVLALRRDGSTVPVELTISEANVNGHPVFTAFMRDVSERKRLEAALVQRAFHDELTGLPNRRLFLDRLGLALARADRHGLLVAVLFLDIDRFKMINDTFGHTAGDYILTEVGRRLAGHLRPSDTVARFGGDEFVILCDEVPSEQEAIRIADRLDQVLRAPFRIDDAEVFVSASVGIALGLDIDPDVLLRNADTAMYRAKERGKARHEVFADDMRSRSQERLDIERDLHRALDRKELFLVYQPEICLDTGRIVGFEALLRWQHPDRGLLTPGDFLDVAEETGLIVPIGTWAIAEACRQAAEWNTSVGTTAKVWVNVSARELTHPTFVETLSATLARRGTDPGMIGLEITESALMEDAPHTIATTEALRDLGIALSIDDFGTGYSSLSYLKRFTVDVLKIDRSFINGLGRDDDDRSIVTAIIALASSLRLNVVAEGVETADQLAVLHDLRCDAAQGYYLARPVPADQAPQLLRSAGPSLPS